MFIDQQMKSLFFLESWCQMSERVHHVRTARHASSTMANAELKFYQSMEGLTSQVLGSSLRENSREGSITTRYQYDYITAKDLGQRRALRTSTRRARHDKHSHTGTCKVQGWSHPCLFLKYAANSASVMQHQKKIKNSTERKDWHPENRTKHPPLQT